MVWWQAAISASVEIVKLLKHLYGSSNEERVVTIVQQLPGQMQHHDFNSTLRGIGGIVINC